MQKTIKVIIILVLLISTGIITYANFNEGKEPPKLDIETNVPLLINGYNGVDEEIPEKLFNLITPEEIIIRKYTRDDREINLAVVVSEDKEDLHAPEVCYKLQGFEFREEVPVLILPGCEISKVNTVRESKPYIFHFYYTDTEKVFKSRTAFWTSYMMDKLMNRPRKKYALVLAYTDSSNQEDLVQFSRAITTYSLKGSE